MFNIGGEMNKKYIVLLVLFLVFISYIQAMPPKPGLVFPQSDYDEMNALGVNKFDNPIRDAGKKSIINQPGDVQLLVSGAKSFPMICVKYPDYSNQYPIDNFQAMIFSDTWSSGSARKFYQEISYGQLNVTGACYDWITADSNRAYYGYANGFARAARLAKEMARKMDSVINYAQYDNDGDGYVDCFTIVHAGMGREESGSGLDIWSHSWTFTLAGIGADTTNDPDPNHPGQYIKIDGYVCDPERSNTSNNGTMVCIGVYCHEWGHALGLPDLYDTDGGGEGLGNWSVISAGSWGANGNSPWKPAHLDAWSKMELGWLNPTAVRSRNLYSIPKVENNAKAYWLISRQRTFKEYFLVENRQKTLFDSLMYNSGLLIYHIDDSVIRTRRTDNKVNAGGTGWKYGVALEQADGYNHLFIGSNRGDAGDPYPGSSNNTSYDTAVTNPNSNTNYPIASPQISGCYVKNISASSAVMSCSLSSGINGRFTGGPDLGGYFWIDSDTVSGPSYYWIDISNSGTVLGNGDDARFALTLPFSFIFYGTAYNTVWVSTNGWLSFGADPGTDGPSNTAIPNASTPNSAVYAFWDDLNLVSADSANIMYQFLGTSPYRVCVITWKDARINGAIQPGVLQPLNTITFQIVLSENGLIGIQYKDCAVGDTVYNWGRSATIGIENSTGTAGLQYLFNGSLTGNLVSNERAVLFFTPTMIMENPSEQNLTSLTRVSNFPNPFTKKTVIKYNLTKKSNIHLGIYNSLGMLVRTLIAGNQVTGNYQTIWDGRDNKNNIVSKGIYFYILNTDNSHYTEKIVKLE